MDEISVSQFRINQNYFPMIIIEDLEIIDPIEIIQAKNDQKCPELGKELNVNDFLLSGTETTSHFYV